jgi:hypothetical protein
VKVHDAGWRARYRATTAGAALLLLMAVERVRYRGFARARKGMAEADVMEEALDVL